MKFTFRQLAAIVPAIVLLAAFIGREAASAAPTTVTFAIDAGGPAAPAAPATSAGESRRPATDADSPAGVLDAPARAWTFDRWLRGGPLTPESLRGKVVLLRFWTDRCRFCEHTLPAIDALAARHANDGLVVIGAYHPNEPGPVRNADVRRWAKRLGFSGPVAIDANWTTLSRYWLAGHPDRNWVSVSFLIDRHGIVRWVHAGGEYHPSEDPRHHGCTLEWAGLEAALAKALAD